MSQRRLTEPHYSGRTGAAARSPAERLEPTRPVMRQRRAHVDRDKGAGRPFVRLLSGALTFVLLLMLLAAGTVVLIHNRMNAAGPLASSKAVTVPKGESAHEIAERLEREGFVTDRRMFMAGYMLSKVAGREDGRSLQLKAGDYLIPQAASARQILDILVEGKTITYKVTIPEGLTSEQIVERLKADTNLVGEITEVPPEGSLLPDTFILQRGASRQSVVDRMQADARKLEEKLWDQRKKDLPLKTWQEAITLASIVEKETGRNDERERVAAVFLNRLKQKMRLQSDPTIVYGISGGKSVVWNRPILRSEILQKTAHNTYQIDGLPPTPICNPGRAAIEAVLNPADTKDLYFVADGSGGHIFSETLKDHNTNVQKWRAYEKDMKAKAASQPSDTPTTAKQADKAGVAAPAAPPDKGKPAPTPPSSNKPKVGQNTPGWTSTTEPVPPQKR
jgi:UPF0755 protein